MNLVRQALFGLGLLAALAAFYLYTQHRLESAQADALTATTRATDLAAALKAAKQDPRIVTKYVDRVRTVYQRGRTITREVPIYVSPKAVAACTFNRGFVLLYNAAAQAVDLPSTARSADAPAAGIGLDTVAGTAVHNLTTCHATAAQLTSLQTWVRAHSAAAPHPP